MGVRVRQKIKGKGNPWWVFVSHNGKRTSRKVGSKRAADMVAAKIQAKISLGEFGFDRKQVPTFGEYAIKWRKVYVRVNCRESTAEEYQVILKNHILPVFKNERVDQITKGSVRGFLLQKHSNGLSRSRVLVIKAVLSGILTFAVDEEIITINPCSGITKRLFPKNRNVKNRVGKGDIFTDQELAAIFDTCETDFPEHYPFFLMAARTGMRLGELLALQWGDVDLKDNYIWVRRSYRLGRLNRPKSGKSRKVDMSSQLAGVLSEMLKGDFKDIKEFVFQHDGRIMEQYVICQVYDRILKKAKVRHIKFHGIRHSYCAHLLSKGVSPYYVSQQVGHSSINITCDTYGSWIRSEDNRHVDLLDSAHLNAPYTHPEGGNIENIQVNLSG